MFHLNRNIAQHLQGALRRSEAFRDSTSIQHPHSVNRIRWRVPALLLCLALAAYGQTDWTRQFGTGANDEARAVAVDSTGVYVLYAVYATTGETTEFMAKYSLDGTQQFNRQIGTINTMRPFAISATAAGVYVVGSTNVALSGQTSAGGTDAFIQRYDTAGNLLWTRQFGTSSYDDAVGVAADTTGVYLAGNTLSSLQGQTSAGGPDAYLRKYDVNGNALWTRQVGTGLTDAGRAVAADASGVYFAGWVGSVLAGQVGAGGEDAFLQKYDANGALLWTRQFGSEAFDNPAAVSLDGSGVYVTGTTAGQFPGQTGFGGGTDGFIQKLDLSGNPQWVRQFGTTSFDFADAGAADGSGIVVAGSTGGTFPGQTAAGILGVPDAFAQKYDANGTLQWTRQFGTSGNDRVAGAAADAGRLFLGGSTSGTLPGQTSAGGVDVFLQSGGPQAAQGALRFVPIIPCRVVDTRPGQGTSGEFGPPTMGADETRTFPLPQGRCSIPSTARAYSLNVTVVPPAPLIYLTMYPAGEARPLVSTLNSFHGGIVANAAITPAGLNGGISVYVTNVTDLVIDINGYFIADGSAQSYSFYTLTPCRVVDTRLAPGPFGAPPLFGGFGRNFVLPDGTCGLPLFAAAYSLNATVVPAGPLGYLTLWPAAQPQPFVSTLNSPDGAVVANAAIVQAGVSGSISAFATGQTDLILDTNGYFGPAGGLNELRFQPVTPCRAADTRLELFGQPLGDGVTRDFAIGGKCGVPVTARAYSLNVTVVPSGALGYLALWPSATARPLVSTLNSFLGRVVANAAIVPAGANSSVSVFVTNQTHVILDVNGYFQ